MLRKGAIVEDQNKVSLAGTKTLQGVAMPAREVPDVARLEVVRLGEAARIDNRGTNPPLEDERPLGRGGMPVRFAHRSGLDPHGNPRKSFGNRQLRDGCLFPVAVADDFAVRLLKGELECRQVLA